MVAATVVAPVPPVDDAGRHIGARHFGDALRLTQRLQLIGFQPDMQFAVDHRNGRRNRTRVADILFDLRRNLDVLRVGHAVCDDGAFQRNDGLACVFGGANLGRVLNVDHSGVSPET